MLPKNAFKAQTSAAKLMKRLKNTVIPKPNVKPVMVSMKPARGQQTSQVKPDTAEVNHNLQRFKQRNRYAESIEESIPKKDGRPQFIFPASTRTGDSAVIYMIGDDEFYKASYQIPKGRGTVVITGVNPRLPTKQVIGYIENIQSVDDVKTVKKAGTGRFEIWSR